MKHYAIIAALLAAGTAHAATAFFQYERSAGYDRKHCFYSYMGNEYVITIPKLRNCPLTIEVNP